MAQQARQADEHQLGLMEASPDLRETVARERLRRFTDIGGQEPQGAPLSEVSDQGPITPAQSAPPTSAAFRQIGAPSDGLPTDPFGQAKMAEDRRLMEASGLGPVGPQQQSFLTGAGNTIIRSIGRGTGLALKGSAGLVDQAFPPLSEEGRAARAATAGQVGPVERVGERIAEVGEQVAPVSRANEQNFFNQVLGAAGYSVPILGASIISPAAGFATAVSMGAGEARERAQQDQATQDEIAIATLLGTVPGAADFIPVARLLRIVKTPVAKSFLANLTRRVVEQSVIEGTTEATQEFLQNLIEKISRNPDQALAAGVPEAAILGAAAGGLFGGGAAVVSSSVVRPDESPLAVPPLASDSRQPEVDQSLSDRPVTTTELLGDSSHTETLLSQGFDALDRQGQQIVLSRMRSAIHDDEIFRTVVESIPVDVVHDLIGPEGTTEDLLHDPSVLTDALAVPNNLPVPASVVRIVEVLMARLGTAETFPTTEKSILPSGEFGRVSREGDATGRAREVQPQEIAPITEQQIGSDLTGPLEKSTEIVEQPDEDAGSRRVRRELEDVIEGGPDAVAEVVREADRAAAPAGTRDKPADATDPAQLEEARQQVDTEPSEAAKDSGTYKKGHVQFQGLDITIENPIGSTRTGLGENEVPWSVTMTADYGYIKRSEGGDGEQVDVYIGPDTASDRAFVVDQIDPKTGKWDEHKVVLGAESLDVATAIYDGHFSDGSGASRRGAVTEMSMPEFKTWVARADTTGPVAYGEDERADIAAPRSAFTSSLPEIKKHLRLLERARDKLIKSGMRGRLKLDRSGAVPVLKLKNASVQESRIVEQQIQTLEAQSVKRSVAGKKRAGKWKGPMDLVTWIRAHGGVQDPGGDLRANDMHRGGGRDLPFARGEQFLGGIVKADGLTLDDAALAAWEAGYFPELSERPTVNEFLNAMTDTFRGTRRIFTTDDQADVDQRLAEQQEQSDLEQAADELGIDYAGMSPAELRRLVVQAQSDATAGSLADEIDADIEAETRSGLEEEPTQPTEEAPDEPIPFFDEPRDRDIPGAGQEIPGPGPAGPQDVVEQGREEAGARAPGAVVAPPEEAGGRDGGPQGAPEEPVAAEPVTEQTDQGEQVVVPGVAPVTDRDRIDVQAGKRLAATKPQKAADEGLFDVEGRGQGDLVDLSRKPTAKPVSVKPEPAPKAPAASPLVKARAAKLRKAADGLQKRIDELRSSGTRGQAVTARRARIIAGQDNDADVLEGRQQILRRLADEHEAGTVPKIIAGIETRPQVDAIVGRSRYPEAFIRETALKDLQAATKGRKGLSEPRKTIERIMMRPARNGIYRLTPPQIGHLNTLVTEAGKRKALSGFEVSSIKADYADSVRLLNAGIANEPEWVDAKELLKEYRGKPSQADNRAKELAKLERELIGVKIPGYFPTPPAVVNQMIEKAGIEPNQRVLEPSAGKGNIADELRARLGDRQIKVVERQTSLREILTKKGHELVGSDFLELSGTFDRIVMNPPFEKFQDIEHVRHAYDLLAPGGRLVSIMGEGTFFRETKSAKEFRDWLDKRGAVIEKLPEGSFKSSERPTGVATRMVVIDKPAAKAPKQPRAAASGEQALKAHEGIANLRGQTTRPDVGVAAAEGLPKPQRIGDLITRLSKALGVPVRQGRISTPNALGIFKIKPAVIRVLIVEELSVFAHEAGHKLDQKFSRLTDPWKMLHLQAMEDLAYEGVPKNKQALEGFAEFVRLYITKPDYDQIPNGLVSSFEGLMRDLDPQLLKDMKEIQAAYRDWLNASSGDVGATRIVSTDRGWVGKRVYRVIKEHRVRDVLHNWSTQLYTQFVDDLHPLKLAVEGLLSVAEQNLGRAVNLEVFRDAYKLMRMSRDAHAAGHMDILYGVRNYDHMQAEGPGLADALTVALGDKLTGWKQADIDRFGKYLASRRLVHEWDRFEAGELDRPPDALSKGDHDQIIAETDEAHPEYADAAQMVYEWNDNLWRKKFDAGLITEKIYRAGLDKHPDYVPIMRDRSDITNVRNPDQHTGPKGAVKRFKGSQRAIINPIDSMMRDAYETASLIAKNDVVRALARLADNAGPGSGAIMEPIPNTEVQATQVSLSEVLEKVKKDSIGLSARDAINVAQAIDTLDDLDIERVTLFRRGEINTRGEPIVFVYEKGERKAYRLADGQFGIDIYNLLMGLDRETTNIFFNLMAKASQLLRLGITTNPAFFFANLLRDQVSAFILTDVGFIPFADAAKGVYGAVTQNEAFQMYNAAGGIMGGVNVAAVDTDRINIEIKRLNKNGIKWKRFATWRGFAEFTEVSETGTRLAIFERARKSARNRGLTDKQAALEASYIARDYIDFGRHGSKTLIGRRIMTFINAGIQGLNKTIRALSGEGSIKKALIPYVKRINGQRLSATDKRNLRLSGKAWASVSALGVLGLALSHLYRDDEEYQEFSEYLRATHWMIKVPGGGWWAWPKPFEMAFMSNLFERAYERLYYDDPKALGRMWRGFGEIMIPPHSVAAVAPPLEIWANKRFFDGRPIIPQRLMRKDAFLRFNHWNSDFSKWLGRQIDVSPAVIDHVVSGYSGSWGRDLLRLTSEAVPGSPSLGADDMFVISRFAKDPTRGSVSAAAFYDEMGWQTGRLGSAYASYTDFVKNPEEGDATEYLAKLDKLTQLYVIHRVGNANAGRDSTRKLHPMERAKDVVRILYNIRDEVREGDLAPRIKQRADNLLATRILGELRNSLIITGVDGYQKRGLIDLDENSLELKRLDPSLEKIVTDRMKKGKIPDRQKIYDGWPDLRAAIQRTLDSVLSSK